MLSHKLLHYVNALNLEPLWIHKKHIDSLLSSNSGQQHPPKATYDTQTKEQTPDSIFSNLPPTNVNQKTEETIINPNQLENEIHKLEIKNRAQFIITKKNNASILIGFLSAHLNQYNHPLYDKSYTRLMNSLLKQLNLSVMDPSLVIRQHDLENQIQYSDIQAILLFSQSFQSSELLRDLQKKNIPILVLEHPCSLLRNPLLKQVMWLKLKQFFIELI